jgi:ABC-type uncharacterized transport system fused permease/ATPase subunit
LRRYIFWLIVFAILEISGALYLTIWRENFWNAISLKQGQEIITQLGIFTGVALVMCFVSGFSGYLVNLTAIAWRKKLDKRFRELYGDSNERH